MLPLSQLANVATVSSKRVKTAIVEDLQVADLIPVAIRKHVNSPPDPSAMTPTMNVVNPVNSLRQQKYVVPLTMGPVIQKKLVRGIHRLVQRISLLRMAKIVGMDDHVRLALVPHEIFNVNKLSTAVPVLVTTHHVC
jgi:hypothetical protein